MNSIIRDLTPKTFDPFCLRPKANFLYAQKEYVYVFLTLLRPGYH
jgi:hypothetical protein